MTAAIACIGGTDSSGGAGVTRDCITADTLGVHALPVVTLISAQTDADCLDIALTSPLLLQRQLTCLLQENPPRVIKIGAIGSDAQAYAIVAALKQAAENGPLQVVWDPVTHTSSGKTLSGLSPQAIRSLSQWVDVITPNISELEALSGSVIESSRSIAKGAQQLQELGIQNVLVKGGHASWNRQARDTLFSGTERYDFISARNQGELRGTGCRLASAIAACLALEYDVPDAVCVAKASINHIWHGRAHGWPDSPRLFPRVVRGENDPLTNWKPESTFPRLSSSSPGLYPVVDSVDWLKALLPTGCEIIQLRIKNESSTTREEIMVAVALAKQYNCQLFINDHWQLAIECGAYGVHLGQEDLAQADLAAIARAGLRLGISTHGYAELCRILPLQPSYVALGHIFATRTKQMPSKPQGVERLERYVALCENIPTVAIGGISLTRAAKVWATGVDSVAVVSAITQAEQPLAVVAEFKEILSHAG